MAKQKFLDCMAQVWKNEVWSGNEEYVYTKDGYHTKFGIAFEFNEEHLALVGIFIPEQIKDLTKEQAFEIYYNKYWLNSHAALLTKDAAYLHFDAAVNQGLFGAAKMLQESLNIQMPNGARKLKIDGKIGPKTKHSANMVTKVHKTDLFDTYRIIREREYFKTLFERCRKRPDELEGILDDFEKSWVKRLRRI